jgi:hypothetical protein
MIDLTSHTRDDIVELPSDCEMPRHACGCTPYLCPVCRPRRSLLRAQLEVSLQRMHTAEVISLAHARAERRRT